jgi:hypothetical protein
MNNTDPTLNRGSTQVFKKVKQFLPLIRHPPCYSYKQDVFDTTRSSPVWSNAHMSSTIGFYGVHVTQSSVFCVVFCRSLYGHLSVIFWLLYCPSIFDLHTSDSGYCIACPSLIYILLIAAIVLPVHLWFTYFLIAAIVLPVRLWFTYFW